MFPPEIVAAIVYHCSTFQPVQDAIEALSALACTSTVFAAEVKREEYTGRLLTQLQHVIDLLSAHATFHFPQPSLGTVRALAAFLEEPEQLQCPYYKTVCFYAKSKLPDTSISTLHMSKREIQHMFEVTDDNRVLICGNDDLPGRMNDQVRALFVKGKGKTTSVIRRNTVHVRCSASFRSFYSQRVYLLPDSQPVCVSRDEIVYRIKLSQTAVEAVRKAKEQGYIQRKETNFGNVYDYSAEELLYYYYMEWIRKHKHPDRARDIMNNVHWDTYFQIDSGDTTTYWTSGIFLTEVTGPPIKPERAPSTRKRRLNQEWVRSIKQKVEQLMTEDKLCDLPLNVEIEVEDKLRELERLINRPPPQ